MRIQNMYFILLLSIISWGCDEAVTPGDEGGSSDSGTVAGDAAGDEAGDTAGDTVGDTAGDTAGDMAGDMAGNMTGNTAGETADETAGTPSITMNGGAESVHILSAFFGLDNGVPGL